mgnify:CR=1 FL=1
MTFKLAPLAFFLCLPLAHADLPARGSILRVAIAELDGEASGTIQLPARTLHFRHTWYQYWPSRLIEQLALGKKFDVYEFEFAVLNSRRDQALYTVTCDARDWVDDGYFLIEECVATDVNGNELSASARAALPASVSRIANPHFHWMVMYEELGLK